MNRGECLLDIRSEQMATADDFDPYRKWLGIPADEQPPHHYRLLGIALFEDDPDVIQNAADRQMKHVRTFQMGRNAALSQRILNELSQARVTLLSPAKADYDAKLKASLTPAAPAPQAPPPPPSAEPAPEDPPPGLAIQTATTPRPAAPGARPRVPDNSSGGSSMIWVFGGLGAIVAIGAGLFFSGAFGGGHKNPQAGKGDSKTSTEKPGRATTPVNKPEPKPVDPVRPPVGPAFPPPPMPTASLDDHLKDARLAMIRRDFEASSRQIDSARELAKSDEDKSRVAHVETLQKYVEGFWSDARAAIDSLKLTTENNQPTTARFEAGRRSYELLKREGESITYKVNGNEHKWRLKELPEIDAVAFALHGEGERTAQAELHIAAFMALEFGEGRREERERERARDHWRKAASQGLRDRAVAEELGLQNEVASAGPMPEPKPPEPKPNPSPAAPAKPNRLAAPAQAELKQSEAKITQKYGAEIAAARTDPGEKRKLAKTLYLDFLQEGNDSALRYASLEKSFEMAVELGELEKLVLPLLEEFQETFEVDTDLLAAGAFDRLLAQPEWHGEQASVIQKASSEQWPKALRSHHYAAAIKLSELSVRAARLAMSKEAAALDRRAKELSQFIGVLELWDQAAEKGSKKLQLVSDDPTAHYQVGVMECLGKENWEEGLPHLAKGSDAELKSPASKELAMPAAPADQLALAQSWIEIARQKRGLAALHLFKHARAWIEKAMQGSGVPREMAAAMQQEADTQIVRLSKTLDDLTANVAAP